jgi:hypothetical protein
VMVPTSSSCYCFKRNIKSHEWFDNLLDALSLSKETSVDWLLQSFSDTYNEEFIAAAEGCGLLLNGEKMDAESAVAMWEEANCNL